MYGYKRAIKQSHGFLAELCAPHVHPDQTFTLLLPGSGGPLVFGHILRGKQIVAAETVTLPYACRLVGPAQVHIHAGPGRPEVFCIFPAVETGRVIDELRALYPTLVPADNVLEVALYNPNGLLHTVGALFNLDRIEFS